MKKSPEQHRRMFPVESLGILYKYWLEWAEANNCSELLAKAVVQRFNESKGTHPDGFTEDQEWMASRWVIADLTARYVDELDLKPDVVWRSLIAC